MRSWSNTPACYQYCRNETVIGDNCCPFGLYMKGNDNMAEKRRDHRGIVLEKGESQDSSGRYRYRYYDDKGISHDIYAWRLRPEDATPEGKKHGESLREMEARIQKDMLDNIKAWKAGMTVNQLVKEYIGKQTKYWAQTTCNNINSVYNTHIKNKIGKKKVNKITPDMVEDFYIGMMSDKKSPVQIGVVSVADRILNGSFKLAVKKNVIRSNPAERCLGSVKKKINPPKNTKHSLEENQQQELLRYIQNNNKYSRYYPLFYLLAWTGCRIGEMLGLTWYDIDFVKETITIDHSLAYTKIDGRYQFVIGNTKTENGIREIPMLGDVKKILLEMREEAGWSKVVTVNKPKITIQNPGAFLFVNSRNHLTPPVTVEHLLKKIITEYNKEARTTIEATPHTFRHSFCCWLCENVSGENTMDDIKYIQSIMGHKDASTTLNIYSELRKGNAAGKHEALKKKAARM